MHKVKILIFYFFISSNLLAQQEIVYYVAPSVKDSLQKNVKLNNEIACLWLEDGEFINLIFFEIDLPILDSLTQNTSRYLYFDDNKRFPIIFYSDFYFSSICNKENNGVIISREIALGGYFIRIDGSFKSGKILKSYNEY